ncbi:MAG: hypothetical protein GF308_09160 [Candidatus Heimdallarchaeota archaeon]|nr:hypothetical protein [Candidatus Heimdallarchaeota archaeon]
MTSEKNNSVLKKIKEAEEKIEVALWLAAEDLNFQKELETYRQVKENLLSLTDLSNEMEKERNRVLSFCLMRIDNSLGNLGHSEKAVERTKEALNVAEKSEDLLAISRCLLALGTRLIEQGEIEEAEKHFNKIFTIAENNPQNKDIQQTKGWTLITKGHFAHKMGICEEALVELRKAEEILRAINNYAGIAQANELMAKVYLEMEDPANADRCIVIAEEFKEKALEEKK